MLKNHMVQGGSEVYVRSVSLAAVMRKHIGMKSVYMCPAYTNMVDSSGKAYLSAWRSNPEAKHSAGVESQHLMRTYPLAVITKAQGSDCTE